MKFTAEERRRGENNVCLLSEKSQWVYNETFPFEIYKYYDEDDNELYAFDGALGSADHLALKELDEILAGFYDDIQTEEMLQNDREVEY